MNICPYCDGEGENLDMMTCSDCEGTGVVKELEEELE